MNGGPITYVSSGIGNKEASMEGATDTISRRLCQLELKLAELQRSNRRLRHTIGALVLCGGALIGMAQASSGISDSVEARQFVLRDSSGRVRAALGSNPDGAVGLNLDDANGRTLATLVVDSKGSPGLDLYDQGGKRRAVIAVSAEGVPGVGLYDANGRLKTSLDAPAVNTPGLAFYNDGKPVWGMP
jgi:hypothetical protein